MSTLDITDLTQSVETDNKIQLKSGSFQSMTSLFFLLYRHKSTELKGKVDDLSTEIKQRQKDITQVNNLIQDLNGLTDVKNNRLDISNRPDLQQQLEGIRQSCQAFFDEEGMKIPEQLKLLNQLKFENTERVRLIEFLHLQASTWDKKNAQQMQQINVYVKHLDSLFTMMAHIQKNEVSAGKAASQAARGG